MNDDSELLEDYLNGSEEAFRELVARYVNLVYSAALRPASSPVQTAYTLCCAAGVPFSVDRRCIRSTTAADWAKTFEPGEKRQTSARSD